jgi:hypothetical protein
VVRLLGTIRIDTEKFESALLDRGGLGVKGEVFVERCGGLDAAIGGEIGEEGLEAVYRQAVVSASCGLLANGGFGTRGLGDDAGAHCGGCGGVAVAVIARGWSASGCRYFVSTAPCAERAAAAGGGNKGGFGRPFSAVGNMI